MKKVIISGPIGAGKSLFAHTMASLLEEKGLFVHIVELDVVGKRALETSEVQENLCKSFGDDVVFDGCVNVQLLAKRAFVDEKNTAQLNAITHDAIAHMVERDISEVEKTNENAIVLIETPFPVSYLRTTRLANLLSDACTVAVLASFESRMVRCAGHITDAQSRDERQREYGSYDGDIVIQNDASEEKFLQASLKALELIMKECL